METKYILHSVCFDKEELRQKSIVLNDSDIDYQINQKSIKSHFKAPLGGYFEVELLIAETDFEKANELLETVE